MKGDNDRNDKNNNRVADVGTSPNVGIAKKLEVRIQMGSRGDTGCRIRMN